MRLGFSLALYPPMYPLEGTKPSGEGFH